MNSFSLIQKIIIWSLPVIFAITVHEVAHGWIANKLGDPTARMLGRLTLNPIKHIDPIGTLLIPGLLLILPGVNFVFGWAKPVPVTYSNLRNPRRDMALVALAGPVSNLIMALMWAGIAKIGLMFAQSPYSALGLLIYMGSAGIMINLVLLILNLIPLPPLDGSRVVSSFLSPRMSLYYNQLENYGFIILLLLLSTGVLSKLLAPAMTAALILIASIFQLPLGTFM